MIIRLCRTFPRKDYPGIGLHCYNFSKFIDHQTIIFTKKIDSPPVDIPKNAKLIEIDYSDLSFNRKEESLLRIFLIILSKIWGEFIFSFNVLKYLKQNKINISILHLHSINFLITAILIKLLYRCPSIMNFGGTDLLRLKKSKIMKHLASKIDGYLYVAQSMKLDLDKLFNPKKNFYMGNGVDLELFKPNLKFVRDQMQFFAIGNLRWQKGYDLLIEAFSNVAKIYPDIKLLIAGDGPLKEQLKGLVINLKLERNIFLLGICSRNELVTHLSQSKGFIMSSVAEGFPKALIEAIACEVPVIVTDVGECANIAKHVGIIVQPNDPNRLSEAIIKFITNEDSYIQMQKNCSEERLKYSWLSMTERVRAAYKEIS